MTVKAKKHLGQHFLTDKNTAHRIVSSLHLELGFSNVLEVGPGMGILTDFLLEEVAYETWMVDIDGESIEYLKEKYPNLGERLIHGDFLKLDFKSIFNGKNIAVIGLNYCFIL